MQVKGKIISTLVVIDTFFVSFAVGFNSRHVLIVDPSMAAYVQPVAASTPTPPPAVVKPATAKTRASSGKTDASVHNNSSATQSNTSAAHSKTALKHDHITAHNNKPVTNAGGKPKTTSAPKPE